MTETEKRVPDLRFKGFIEDWEQRKFSNVVNRVSQQSNDSNLPKVEFEDIVSGEGRLNKDISHKFDSRKGTVFEPEFILYGKLRPYLKNWLFPNFKGIALGDFWVFEPNNSSSIFDYYLIQSDKYQTVANISSGTKMPRSDWKTVSETVFSIPDSINEQEKIGAFFKHLDNTIALHQRKLDKSKQLKLSYLSEMFPVEGECKPKRRFIGFTDDWEQRKLIDVCSIITKQTGFDYSATIKPSLIRSKMANTYPFIQNKDFSGFNINTNTDFFIPTSIAEKFPKIILDVPSLLVTISGNIGNVGFYDKKDRSFIGGAVGICKLKDPEQGAFIIYELESEFGQKQFKRTTKTSSHANITVETIKNLNILFPKNHSEYIKIGSFFKRLDETIALHQHKLEKLKNIKQAYLNEMFV